MSFFSNLFQSTIGKVITIAAAAAAVVFTGGAAAALFGLETAAGGFVAASLGLTGAAAAAVGLAGSVVAAAIITSALSGRSPQDPFAGTNGDLAQQLGNRQLSGAMTSNSLPWVIGNAYISGQVFDTLLSTDQQTIWYAMAVSEVGTNQTFSFDLTKCYWGDKQIVFDNTDQTKVAYLVDNAGGQDSKVAGYIYMYFFTNGSSSGQNTTQTAIQIMSDNAIPMANRWPATNVMNQAAFVIVKLIYNTNAGVTGLVVPKFRLTSNAAFQRPGTIWYEYLTNTRFGLGVPAANVDQTSANAWDAYANQLITYTPAGGGTAVSQPRYRFNGVIDTKQTFRNNLDLMMANGDAFFRFDEVNNKWQVVPNQASTSVFSFNDNNIIGAFNFSPKQLRDTYTGAVISFPDANIRDQQNNVYLDVPDSLLKPNVPPNTVNLSYALTNDNVQAQYLANRILEQAQEDLIISFNASFNAAGIQAGDVIDVTNSTYGWTAKLFRVAEVREQTDDTLGLYVNLLCVEYNDQVYDNFNITAFTPAPNTNLPDPTFFGTLTAPTVMNVNPTATIPNFEIMCTIPTTGVSSRVDLYYNTTNSFMNAAYLQTQYVSVGTAYTPGSTVTFLVTTLPQNNYYFFFKVANSIASSQFSPSASNMWNPQPTGTTSGVAINPDWSPPVILIPANADNTPIMTGQSLRLGIYGGTTLLNFSNVNNDAAMANNSWRIDTTMLTTGITLSALVATTNYATWTVTGITVAAGTFTVGLRYKDNAGVTTAVGNTIISINEVIGGGTGSTAYLNYSTFYFTQNNDGSYPTASQNIIFSILSGSTTITKTQPVSVNSTGQIQYGTPSGDTGITIATTGSNTQAGTITFTQTSSGISLTSNVLVNTLSSFNTVINIYYLITTVPNNPPPKPTGGTFDTSTRTVTPPTGWNLYYSPVAVDTSVWYQCQTTLNYKLNSGIVALGNNWTNPQPATQRLLNGATYTFNPDNSPYLARTATLKLYARPSSGTPPYLFNATYTSSTNTLVAPFGWSLTPPTTTYDPLYETTFNFATTSNSDVYGLSVGWSFPVITITPPGQIANTVINRTGAQPVTVPPPTNAEIATVYKRSSPSFGDAVVIKYGSPVSYVSFTYNGTSWVQAASFIKGDQVVDGTITAQQIAAQTIVGNLIAANTIDATKLNVNQLSAITANMGSLTAGNIRVGNSPAISGTTMTGFGAELNLNNNGDFALGNPTNNIVFPGGAGGAITINGRLIVAGNIVAKTITANECNIDNQTIIGAAGSNQLQVGTINTGQVVNRTGNVTYEVTNYVGPSIQLSSSATTLFNWSSTPGGTGTVTIPYLVQNNSGAAAQGICFIGSQFAQKGSASTGFIPSDGVIRSGTFAFTFSGGPSAPIIGITSIAASGFLFQIASPSGTGTTVSIVFSNVLNPSPSSKTLVAPPSFNTYP